ncbi:MAG: O-antigen ligase family protein [Opitutales bacterium]
MMNILYTIFLVGYSIGCFFSEALCYISYGGFLSVALFQLCNTTSFRSVFKQFFKSNKIGLGAVFIVVIAFAGVFYCEAPQSVRWFIFGKYVRFLSIILLIPAFIYNKLLPRKFIHCFCLATLAYCLWYYFIGDFAMGNVTIRLVNPIPASVFVACCSLFALNLLFYSKKSTKLFPWVWFSFFLYFLLCINPEKTGPLAFTVAFTVALSKAHLRKILILVFISVSGILLFALYRPSVLMQRFGITNGITNLTKSGSVSYRVEMMKNCFTLIQEKPMVGHGTGSFGHELKQHGMTYIGYGFSYEKGNPRVVRTAHPHNEWLFWLVQWGSLGFMAVCLWFGWILVYLIKNRKVDFCLLMQGICLNITFIMAGCCDCFFRTTIAQSFYLMALCACIGAIEQRKIKPKRLY